MSASAKTWNRLDWAVLCALAALPFVALSSALRGDACAIMGDGVINLPYRILVARRVFSGVAPFWLPEAMGGMDLWAHPVAGAVNPLTYLFGIFPALWVVNIITILVYSAALSGMCLFCREWGLGRGGAATAALAYAFCGFFFSYHDFSVHGMAQSCALLPFMLTAYLRLARRPGPKRAAVAAMATFAMGAVPQDQVFVYGMVHAGFVTLAASRSAKAGERRGLWFWAGAAAALGAAALMARILPAMNVMENSIRGQAAPWIDQVNNLGNVVRWHTIFNPFGSEDGLRNLFFGELPFFLLLVALFRRRRSGAANWAIAGMIIGWAGVFSVVIPPRLARGLPVLGWFHSPYRHLFETLFWASVLAGAGADRLTGKDTPGKTAVIAALCSTLLLAAALVTAGHIMRHESWAETARSFSFVNMTVLAVAGAYAISVLKGGARSKKALLAALLAAIIVPRVAIFRSVVDKRVSRSGVVAQFPIPSPAVEYLKKREAERGTGPPLSRGIYLGHIFSLKGYLNIEERMRYGSPNMNMLYGMPLVQTKNELAPSRLEMLMSNSMRLGYFMDMSVLEAPGAALSLLNARYVLLPNRFPDRNDRELWPLYRTYLMDDDRATGGTAASSGERRRPLIRDRASTVKYLVEKLGCERIYRDDFVSVFERPGALPRQWLSSKLEIMTPEQIADRINERNSADNGYFDLMEVALAEDPALAGFGREMSKTSPDRSARIERMADGPNFVSFRTSSRAPVFAVFSEAWAAGWRATMDGKPVKIHRAFLYLRGLPVPPGEHVVEMRYRPAGFIPGVTISLAAMLCIAGLWIAPATPFRKRKGPNVKHGTWENSGT